MEKEKNEMQHIEEIIGKILRVGVIFSAIVIGIGLLMLIITNNSGYPADTFPKTFKTIFSGVIALKPYAIIMFGTFCLIFTPVLRVIVSIYAFYKEQDWLYVKITLIVLLILIISFIIGRI